MKVIDTHCYCLSNRQRDPAVELGSKEIEVQKAIHHHPDGVYALEISAPDKIKQSMEQSQIDLSVLVSFPWFSLTNCRENNDFVLELAHKEPSMFQAVCSVSPSDQAYLKEAERALEAGAIGIKMNPNWQHFKLSQDEFLKDLNVLVQNYNAYFLIHTDQAYKKSDAQAADLFTYAKENKKSKIVLAHMGGMLGIYSALPFMKGHFDNLWFDTAISETLQMVRFYVQSGLENRIVMGTDYPFNLCHSQKDVKERIEALDLGAEITEKVFSKNFEKLLESKL